MLTPSRSVRLSNIVAAVVVAPLLFVASARSARAQSPSAAGARITNPGALATGTTGSYKNVGWNILDGFSIDPYTTNIKKAGLPANVTALDSVNVKIGGYMLPFEFGGTGVTEFALTESLDSCGFGEMLVMTNWVDTYTKPGKSATYFEYEYVEAFGRLRIYPSFDNGQIVNLYRMVLDSVRLAK
jgi:hypothetical protein